MAVRPSAEAAPRPGSNVLRATLIGATAVGLWSTLPTLSTFAGSVPPFQLTAMAFAIAFAAAVVRWLVVGATLTRCFAWPRRAWLLGLYGLFGYHFCYFMALRHAPPAEASLINHLWPVLIVVLSSLLPGERLRWWHAAGALAGLAGAILLVTGGGRVAFQSEHATGYGFAIACALIWSTYSVLNRRFNQGVSSEAVGAFCGGTAVLAAVCHLGFEQTAWPAAWQWPIVIALGLGPLGAAFFVWDYGCKRGDIRVLAALAYLTPLLSTALLIAIGFAAATATLAAACVLVAGGAALASRDLFRQRVRT